MSVKKFVFFLLGVTAFLNFDLTANAQVLKVLTDDNPILRTVCIDVADFDKYTIFKVDNVKETLVSLQGAGLAANQVGYTDRFFAISSDAEGELTYDNPECQREAGQPLVFINPKIVNRDSEQIVWEGCFSLPGCIYKLKRPMNVIVEAFDVNENKFTFKASGFWAKCVCHEYDHLDGILCKDNSIEVKPYP